MSKPALTPVEQQVRRVARRLFVQIFLDRLAWCWAGALALSAVWLLAQPLLLPALESWLGWAVTGGLAVLAAALAAGLACRAAPSRLSAALALDERFGLRERVTTALSLPPGQDDSSAAQALRDDANRRVAGLDVPGRFPVRLSRSAALVPLGLAALAAVAFFYDPGHGDASATRETQKQAAADAKEADQKLADLKKKLTQDWPKDQPKAAELKELDKLLDKLLSQPVEPKDKEKLRERIKQLRPVEEKLKQRITDLKGKADRAAQVKEALKDLQAPDPKAPKEGMGKELRDALKKGDFQKAAEEVERLRKKMDKGQMKPEEKAQLEKEMRDLERQLQRLGAQQELRDRLKEALDKGELAREQFEQEMEKLDEMAGDLQDLKDLAGQLGEAMKAMKAGDKLGAGKKLKALAGKLARLDADGKELKGLEENAKALQEAEQAMLLMMMGKQGQGQRPGQDQKDAKAKGNGKAGGGPPGRERGITKKGPAEFEDGRQKVAPDEKGRLRVTGFRRGGTFAKIPEREVGQVFRRARQEAPAAIDRQRVPPDAAEMLKGYFENLGGQK
jgi:hypothetical protein